MSRCPEMSMTANAQHLTHSLALVFSSVSSKCSSYFVGFLFPDHSFYIYSYHFSSLRLFVSSHINMHDSQPHKAFVRSTQLLIAEA